MTHFIRYKNKDYSLVKAHGGTLFIPQAFGLEPEPLGTGAQTGYQVKYRIDGKRLFLQQLDINVVYLERLRAKLGKAFKLFGVSPIKGDSSFHLTYPELGYKMDFSGHMVLAHNYLWELDDALDVSKDWGGRLSLWLFEEVLELVFSDGLLKSANDKTAEMIAFRDLIEKEEGCHTLKSIKEKESFFFRDTFGFDYWKPLF